MTIYLILISFGVGVAVGVGLKQRSKNTYRDVKPKFWSHPIRTEETVVSSPSRREKFNKFMQSFYD